MPTQNAEVAAVTAPQLYSPADFKNLTKMPIQIIYGDNIDFNTPSPSDAGIIGVCFQSAPLQLRARIGAERILRQNRRDGSCRVSRRRTSKVDKERRFCSISAASMRTSKNATACSAEAVKASRSATAIDSRKR